MIEDILSADIIVPIDSSGWEEKLYYDKNTARKNLMDELYIRYLSGGDEYKVRLEEIATSHEPSRTKKIVVSLHIKKVEEQECVKQNLGQLQKTKNDGCMEI